MKYVTKIILIMTCLIIMLPFGGCGRKKQVTAQKAGVYKKGRSHWKTIDPAGKSECSK